MAARSGPFGLRLQRIGPVHQDRVAHAVMIDGQVIAQEPARFEALGHLEIDHRVAHTFLAHCLQIVLGLGNSRRRRA
jgi:hypothetical protein